MCVGGGVHKAHEVGRLFKNMHLSPQYTSRSFIRFTKYFNSLKEQTETPLILYFCAIHLLKVYNFIHYYLILLDI